MIPAMASAMPRAWGVVFAAFVWLSCWAGGALAQESAQAAPSPLLPDDVDNTPLRAQLPTTEIWHGDLDGMRKRRLIRILVPYSKTFYYIDSGGRQFGATYEKADVWQPKVVIDGRLMTGQNPASGAPLAEEIVAALNKDVA